MREQQQIQLEMEKQTYFPNEPLNEDEKEGIVLAVKSAFLKLGRVNTNEVLR